MNGRGWTLAITWGSYGGFYFVSRFCTRLCLGWLALTWIPEDIDVVLERLIQRKEAPNGQVPDYQGEEWP